MGMSITLWNDKKKIEPNIKFNIAGLEMGPDYFGWTNSKYLRIAEILENKKLIDQNTINKFVSLFPSGRDDDEERVWYEKDMWFMIDFSKKVLKLAEEKKEQLQDVNPINQESNYAELYGALNPLLIVCETAKKHNIQIKIM